VSSTSSLSNTLSSGGTTSVDGLVSGLNTTDIINSLIAAERTTQDQLKSSQQKAKDQVAAYQSLNTKLASLRDAARALAGPSGWGAMTATSTNIAVATATASAGAFGGSLSFTVNNLATGSATISTNTVAALTSVITTGPLYVTAGGQALGVAMLKGGAGLSLGSHTVAVTQSSAGATKTASTALAGSVVITAGVNDTLSVNVGGAPKSYTIAAGTYSAGQLATAVQTASNGDLRASVDATGHLALATVAEGSAASVQITGGSALTDLGLTGAEVGGAASTGTDGIVTVDGTATTITDVRAGQSMALAGGVMTATLSGGLRVGSITGKNVDTGDGSLSAVINAINNASAGVSATSLQVAPGQYKLEIASTSTGTKGAESVDTSTLTGFSGFASLSTAADASITIGSGASAFDVSSSSNQVSNVLNGVTLNLTGTGTATITTTHDVATISDKVKALVDQVNTVNDEIRQDTVFDTTSLTGGVLIGDFTVRQLQSNLTNALLSTVSASATGTAASVGISIDKTGSFSFDASKFSAAYNSDPNAVTSLFQAGGSAASTSVAFASSTNATRAGSYDVRIAQAATAGVATGAVVGGGSITNGETIDLRVGGATGTVATYSAAAGASLQSIADGLNQVIGQNGFALLASVQGGALVVSTTGYGQNAAFDIRTSAVGAGQTGIAAAANVWQNHAGTNVAGTINGIAATGVGRLLQAPPADPTLSGLVLTVSATQAQVTAAGGTLDLGNFTYSPGLAQQIATVGNDAVDVVSGTLTAAINGHQSEIDDLQQQIDAWDTRLASRAAQLRQQFSDMETALSQMKQQSQWLAGQVNSLTGNSTSGK